LGSSGSYFCKRSNNRLSSWSFAGFTIDNPSLLNLNATEAIMITTYLNNESRKQEVQL
jgi:hypothetical protein